MMLGILTISMLVGGVATFMLSSTTDLGPLAAFLVYGSTGTAAVLVNSTFILFRGSVARLLKTKDA